MNWKLGDTSRKYEVGRGGPGTVSTGRGDHGGVSYGTYQLSSKTGTCARFVKMMGLTDYFTPHKPGSTDFSDLWRGRARTDPNFGAMQHEFIKKTHYDKQIALLESFRIFVADRGPGVKDAVWSTSVQFGGRTSLIRKALGDQGVHQLTDIDIVTRIQDYKIRNNQRLFRSSSANVRKSTLRRARNEKTDLIELCYQYAESKPVPAEPDVPKPAHPIEPPREVKKQPWWKRWFF